METTNKETIAILNDLIKINNDRTEGYQKAIEELKDDPSDLKALFHQYASESASNAVKLESIVTQLGGEAADGTMLSGKIYRAWMDVKSAFSGHDQLSELRACEFGEDAALKAYKAALEADSDISDDIFEIIQDQQAVIKDAHDTIKARRDLLAAAK
ncbi:MAG: PA2169 family four-helix-bundle protein [Cytophagales bacterium]|nr:PA2169 family four-helix-bundle protein [Cytophaga sp.]